METPSPSLTSTESAITSDTILDYVWHREGVGELLSILVVRGVQIAQLETFLWHDEHSFADLSRNDQHRVRRVLWEVFTAHAAGCLCTADEVEERLRAERAARVAA